MTKTRTITLITGNPGKLGEWKRIFPSHITLETADIDLDEIQSLDLEAIIADKAHRAYEHLGTPVVVEDVSVAIASFNGMPGPFIKFFELSMGNDALYQLANMRSPETTVTCSIGYYDGSHLIVTRGEVEGMAVKPRGTNGFGFDACFMPNGSTKTFGELNEYEKDSFSHRGKAIRALVKELERL